MKLPSQFFLSQKRAKLSQNGTIELLNIVNDINISVYLHAFGDGANLVLPQVLEGGQLHAGLLQLLMKLCHLLQQPLAP